MKKKIRSYSTSANFVGIGIMGFILTLVMVLLTACGKDILPEPVITSPVISTTEATSVTMTGAVSGGNISSDGGAKVTDRGVCWGLTNNPSVNDSKISVGSGIGSFSYTLSGLIPGTSYHVRSYATTSMGTFYGNDISFITTPIMYTVTTTAGPNGSVSPNTKEVAKGTSLDLTATPAVGFMTDSIKVNGKSFPLNGVNIYTLLNMSVNTTAVVTFKPDPIWLLSQKPWIEEPRKWRTPGSTTWNNYATFTAEKYIFYPNLKLEVFHGENMVGKYDFALKNDSIIWGTDKNGKDGARKKIILIDQNNLVLKEFIKGYDSYPDIPNPKYDIEVLFTYKH